MYNSSAMEYDVRPPANDAEETQFTDLIIALFESMESLDTPTKDPTWRESLRRSIASEEGAIKRAAFMGGNMVAAMLLHKADKSRWEHGGNTDLELVAIYVAPGFRSAGVGHVMIEVAKAIAVIHGYDRLVLYVLHGNVKAERFYDREGFQKLTSFWIYPTH